MIPQIVIEYVEKYCYHLIMEKLNPIIKEGDKLEKQLQKITVDSVDIMDNDKKSKEKTPVKKTGNKKKKNKKKAAPAEKPAKKNKKKK